MSSTLIAEAVKPRTWDDYVGQTRLKGHLETKIEAALNDSRPFDHTLLVAPPGAGKTTLAELISARLFDDFLVLLMPMKLLDFLDVVEEFNQGVILLDELHAAPKAFQEALQPGLLGGQLSSPSGVKVDVSWITFIGATTTAYRSQILDPLHDRFRYRPHWAPYSDEELGLIVEGMARRAGVDLDTQRCHDLGKAAGGTPRLAQDLVAAARDLLAVDQDPTVEAVLDLAGVDGDGLTGLHLEYLGVLKELGGRAGLRNLANLLQLSASSIEDLERLLVRRGFIRHESNGRKLTPEGRAKLPSSARLVANSRRDRRLSA